MAQILATNPSSLSASFFFYFTFFPLNNGVYEFLSKKYCFIFALKLKAQYEALQPFCGL